MKNCEFFLQMEPKFEYDYELDTRSKMLMSGSQHRAARLYRIRLDNNF